MIVGIFGGTFDPIHTGHLAVATAVSHAFGLSKVVLVPNHRSPLRAEPIASAEERFEMCRLAASDKEEFLVSRVDIDRNGPSYAVDTFEILATEYAGCEFALIAGADILDELADWRDTIKLLSCVLMIVVDRPGVNPVDVDSVASDLGVPGRIVRHRARPVDVSSTQIRQCIASGLPYRHFLHQKVYDYIQRHHIYGAKSESSRG